MKIQQPHSHRKNQYSGTSTTSQQAIQQKDHAVTTAILESVVNLAKVFDA